MSGLDFDPVGRIIRLPDKQQAEWLRDEYERGKRDGAAEERDAITTYLDRWIASESDIWISNAITDGKHLEANK